MLFSAKYTIDESSYHPVWNGNKWVYNHKQYRSLRSMKSKSSYKLEEKMAKTLVMQITEEIDTELIASIKTMV